jgi:hypothetical protein
MKRNIICFDGTKCTNKKMDKWIEVMMNDGYMTKPCQDCKPREEVAEQ